MAKFSVTLRQTTVYTTTLTISAKDEEAAQAKAQERIDNEQVNALPSDIQITDGWEEEQSDIEVSEVEEA